MADKTKTIVHNPEAKKEDDISALEAYWYHCVIAKGGIVETKQGTIRGFGVADVLDQLEKKAKNDWNSLLKSSNIKRVGEGTSLAHVNYNDTAEPAPPARVIDTIPFRRDSVNGKNVREWATEFKGTTYYPILKLDSMEVDNAKDSR